MIDSKSRALEIHMTMIAKNDKLTFKERMKKSKIDAIDYALKKLSESSRFEHRIHWEAVIKHLNKIP